MTPQEKFSAQTQVKQQVTEITSMEGSAIGKLVRAAHNTIEIADDDGLGVWQRDLEFYIQPALTEHANLVKALEVCIERLEASNPPEGCRTEAAIVQARAALSFKTGGGKK
jgi:hypothetical protein